MQWLIIYLHLELEPNQPLLKNESTYIVIVHSYFLTYKDYISKLGKIIQYIVLNL